MFEFGIRNIMRMNYTRYVALPPAWVDSQVEQGGRIRILMDDEKRLVLSPVKSGKSPAGGELGGTSPAAEHAPNQEVV